MRETPRHLILSAALLIALGLPAGAAPCRLALMLALDVSASVDAREDGFQRGGLAKAMLAPDVVDAFLAMPGRPVSLMVFEWSGPDAQVPILDWFAIETEEDLRLAAGAVGRSVRSRDDMPTALGDALGYAAHQFERGPVCGARTLDVSGDGRNNEGFPPASAYRALPFDGVTVNGLAITGSEAGIAEYYRLDLMHGPGAFVIVADGFRDYERAMRAKLLRELSGPMMSGGPARGPG